jgi:hypothetical protein
MVVCRLASTVISWPGVLAADVEDDVMIRYRPAGISAIEKFPVVSDVAVMR